MNRNYASGGKLYSMHVKPILVDCNFVVNASDSGGLGITNLKGPLVSAVYMTTSATPAAGNPDPEAGYIVVRMQDNYTRMFSGVSALIQSPNSGSSVQIDNSAMTVGRPYTITILGNATAAKWQSIGVPIGVTPAVGVSFVATSNGGSGATLSSRVQAVATNGSTVASIEVVGDPDQSIAPLPSANQGYGSQFILVCRAGDGSIATPAAGSKISLMFYLSGSSVTVQGE